MLSKRASIVAGVAGLVAIGGLSTAGAAAAAAPSAPHWRIVKSVKGQAAGVFTAVVATGKSTGWAFQWRNFDGPTVAWERVGGAWTEEAFPAKPAEEVVDAAATSPSDVWVVTSQLGGESRVLRFNGHAWSVVRVFTRSLDQVSVLSGTDVWAFGGAGVLHYDGGRWAQVGGPVVGGSVVSDRDVWAFNHSNVYHWAGPGHLWKVTSLVGLLPPRMKYGLNDPEVVGILAVSATSVYATGNGNAQDAGGPIAVLHYDGHSWTKVAQGGYGYGGVMSYDGGRGVWIPMPGASGETSYMLHYTNGKLTKVALPDSSSIWAIARVPGSTGQLAGGFVSGVNHVGATPGAVLLQYS